MTLMLAKDIDVGLRPALLQQIVDAVLQQVQPRRIWLFGSRARGSYKRTSDIDIAIECEDDDTFLTHEIEDSIRTLLNIDVVDMRKANPRLRKEILTEGILLYGRV